MQLAVDNTRSARVLARTVALYDTLLANREAELLADLDYYAGKLRELARSDPADLTGLRCLYRQHLRHIGSLLGQLGATA